MKHTRRILSALLAAAMLFSLLPATAFAAAETRSDEVTIDVTEYGADPTGVKESSTAVIAALAYAKTLDKDVQKTIRFPQGEYHFYADYSQVRELYVSNTVGTNQNYKNKHLGILVEDMENVTIDGGGSQFIYHGDITAFAAIRSKNVTFTNFDMDHASPSVVDVTVESYEGSNAAILYIPPCYTYSVSGTTITWRGEVGPVTGTPYWSGNNNLGYQQRFDTIDGTTSRSCGNLPFSNVSSIEQLGNGRLKVTYNSAGNRPVLGRCFQLRNTTRTTPGTFFWESEGVTVSDVDIQFLHGFGMVGQLSKNITLDGVHFGARPGTGRTTAGFADFVQMSSVGGKVTIRNCEFSNPHDDPINIHGTFLKVVGVGNGNKTFTLRYQHNETGGFPQYYVGDEVDFSAQGSMAPVADSLREVVAVTNPGEGGNDLNTITITLDRAVEGITANNYVVENVTYTPEVLIEGCRFVETPTRGILVTTRREVVIQNNYFDRMGMASIFISCDAASWWESGRTENVTIKENVFNINSSNAIFVEPTGYGSAGNRVHKNMTIENNVFNMEGNIQPINIRSVDGLTIRNNLFQRYTPNVSLTLAAASGSVAVGASQATSVTGSGTQYNTQLIQLQACEHIAIQNNTYDNGLNLGVAINNGTAAGSVTVAGDNLTVGGSNQLPAVGTVSYFSSNPSVATVDASGVVTGVSAGTAEIYAYTAAGGRVFESNHLTFTVTGSAAVKPNKIDITSDKDAVDVNGTVSLTAAVDPANAGSVTWSVKPATDGAAATITQDGVLTGSAPGVVEAVATLGGVSGSKLVTVNTPKGLNEAWTVEDEVSENWSLDETAGKVTIKVQSGGDWATGAGGHNYFLTTAPTGDFEAIVKVDNKTCGTSNCWCETGLVLYKDHDNYISVVRKNNGGSPRLAVNSESGGSPTEGTLINDIADTAIYLKLTKSGTSYSGYYSANGTSWTLIRTVTNNISDYKVGFMAINAGNSHGSASSTLGGFKITQNGTTTSVPLVSTNAAPTVSGVAVASASPMALSYTYADADNDAETGSLIAWYVSDAQNGHYTRLENAGGKTLPVTAGVSGKWVKAVVAPRDATGRYGAPVASSAVQAPTQAPIQNDATLRSLSVAGVALSPAFDPQITAYTIDVPPSAAKVTIAAAASQDTATVTGAGEVTLTGTATAANVTVTAPDGATTKTYTVTIRRAAGSNAELSALTATAGSSGIAYASGTRFYQLVADRAAAALTLTAAAADAKAKIEVRFNGEEKGEYTTSMSLPLVAGLNNLELRVTAEDGISTALYRVVVMKPAATDASLASLSVNGTNVLSDMEDSGGLVWLAGDTATLSAAATDPNAAVLISVDGKAVVNGGTVTLTKALTTANIRVVAEDTVTEKNYTLVLARNDPASADLAVLKLGGLTLSPAFDPSVTSYTATSYGSAKKALTAAAAQAGATVTYETVAEYRSGTGQVSGDCRFFRDVDQNKVVVTVTSPDGEHTKTYTINVTVQDSVYLSDLDWESATAGDSTWNGGKPARDVSWESEKGDNGVRPIKVTGANGAEVTFEKGIGTHANSIITYDLTGLGYTNFTAKVGVSYYKHDSSEPHLYFVVNCDGEERFSSGEMLGSTPYKEVNIDITDVKILEIKVTQPSNVWSAHGNWADAKLSGSFPKLSETSDVFIQHIEFEHESHTLYVNENDPDHTMALHPVIKPSGVDQSAHQKVLKWDSSDDSVATVNDGVVTAVAIGTAEITATAIGGATDVCIVTVKKMVEGELSVTGALKFGSTLTANINSFDPDVRGNLTYTWYRGEDTSGTVLGSGSTYVPVKEDIGSVLTLKVAAREGSYYEGEATFTTAKITKADGHKMFDVDPAYENCSADGVNDGKITGLHADHVYQYQKQDDNGNWPTDEASWIDVPANSTEITGLAPGSYRVRHAGDDTRFAGEPSNTVTIVVEGGGEKALTVPANFEGGTVRANRSQIPVGDTVTLTVTPDEGYELAALAAIYTDENDVERTLTPTKGSDGKYTFIMPAFPVTVAATFRLKTYTIGHELEHITCSLGAEANHTATHGEAFTITLTPDEGYNMPRSLTLTETDTGSRFTDYTYEVDADPAKRVLTFANGVKCNITISGEATLKTYTVVYELTDGLTASGAPQSVNHHGALSVTLTAARGYRLPGSVSVTVGGADFDGFSYDPETGVVEISAGKINGNVVITAQGEALGIALQSAEIIGTAQVGRTLSVNVVPALATVDYQWILVDEDGTETPIDGAVGNSYVIPAEAEGKAIRVRVTGTGGYTGTVMSDPTAAVLPQSEPFVYVTSIILEPDETSVAVEGTVQIRATVKPDNATSGILYWSSSDDAIAAVDQNGLVTGVAEGTVTITARSTDTVNFVTAECTVTVTAKQVDIPPQDDPAGDVGIPSIPSTTTTTTTTTNPDGSTTTTVTDNETGTVTETIEKPDGSTEVVETRKDGTVTGTATDAEGGTVEKVTSPEEDVTITVTDKDGEVLAKVEIPNQIPAPATRFADVPEGHWADEAIHSMAALEIVKGVGNNTYNRNGAMKRGDLALILSRMSHAGDGYKLTFTDVPASKYYADGVAWAVKTGVVTGRSEETFAPEDTITREELAVMLYRYAKLLKLDAEASEDALDSFKDGGDTHDWAGEGVAWCVDKGILQGKGGGVLDPRTNVTRAEVAVMLRRFMELMK